MLRYNFNNASSLCARQHGASYGLSRYLFSRTELRNISAGEGVPNDKVGIPYGHLDPSSWMLPLSPGAISAYEDINITVSTSLTRGTPGPMTANTSLSITVSGTLTARGYMSGSVTPFTELSPQNLAAAVWNSDSSTYNSTGTMGKQLNSTKTNSDLIPGII